MAYPFLSQEWMDAARAIRAQYADEVPEVDADLRINVAVTEVPFDDEVVHAFLDTTSGAVAMELGALDEPDVTVTTDYPTAQALFVDQDPTIAMQAFMTGRVKVQGDMMKLMAMQTAIPTNEFSEKIAQEIKDITERPEPVDDATA